MVQSRRQPVIGPPSHSLGLRRRTVPPVAFTSQKPIGLHRLPLGAVLGGFKSGGLHEADRASYSAVRSWGIETTIAPRRRAVATFLESPDRTARRRPCSGRHGSMSVWKHYGFCHADDAPPAGVALQSSRGRLLGMTEITPVSLRSCCSAVFPASHMPGRWVPTLLPVSRVWPAVGVDAHPRSVAGRLPFHGEAMRLFLIALATMFTASVAFVVIAFVLAAHHFTF